MVLDYRDPEERLERAMLRFHGGRISAAEQELLELERLGYLCVELFLYLGHCALDRDQLDVALKRYREARKRGPERPEVLLGLGVLAARRLHFERAVRYLRRATEVEPTMQEAFDNLVLCYAALGRHDEALAAFDRSVALDPRSPHAFFNAAFVHFERGEAKRARELWLRVLELVPDYPDAARMVANCDRSIGRLDAARRRLEALLQCRPRDMDVLADLGLVHEARDEWQTAVRTYARALEVDPSIARVRARLGALLHRHGRVKEGLEYLWRAFEDEKMDPDVAMPLAQALAVAGEPVRAARVLRQFVRACPDDPEPHAVRGQFWMEAGRYARAAVEFGRAQRLGPDEISHLCDHAQALAAAGARARAVEVLEYGLLRFHKEPGPYRLLAGLALDEGRPRRAARFLEGGLKQLPKEPGLTVELAESYLRMGRIPRAMALARRARRSSEVERESLDVLGRAYLALGDHRRARGLADALLAQNPGDTRGIHMRGRALLMGGEPQEALVDLRSYVRSQPHDPGGYQDLALCFSSLGNREAARAQKRIGEFVARSQ